MRVPSQEKGDSDEELLLVADEGRAETISCRQLGENEPQRQDKPQESPLQRYKSVNMLLNDGGAACRHFFTKNHIQVARSAIWGSLVTKPILEVPRGFLLLENSHSMQVELEASCTLPWGQADEQ